jgi:hypothetical protein
MKAGMEDKRKVMILAGLGLVIAVLAVWELHGFFSGPAPTPKPVAATPQPGTQAHVTLTGQPAEAQHVANPAADVTLHLDRLALSEDVEYAGTGRNIFSAASEPVNIPQPIKSARETAKVAPPVPTGPPPPPDIDLKYFGYSQGHDRSIRAFLVRGDDIFIAHTGEIVNHRYQVGAISPGSIQITDLSYNHTQTLPLIAN